jgi:hypothetical protein
MKQVSDKRCLVSLTVPVGSQELRRWEECRSVKIRERFDGRGGFIGPIRVNTCVFPFYFKRASYLRKAVGPVLRSLGEVIRVFVSIEKWVVSTSAKGVR